MFGMETIGSASYLIPVVTLLPWQPQWNLINSFVLSHIELVVATEVPAFLVAMKILLSWQPD